MAFDLLPHHFFTLKDGGKLRYARFEPVTAPRGTVLVVPGRREFIEKKFVELGQPLLNSGYRLIIVEPRNQGLSSRFLPYPQQQRDHIEDFNTHLDDLRAFFSGVVQKDFTAPLIVHGHSLGGHVILRWLAEDRPTEVVSAFLTAPMLAFNGAGAHLAAHGISWSYVHLLHHATEYAASQHDFDATDRFFDKNVLTQDPERFAIIGDYFNAHPDLTVGGVTWGWLLAALRSIHTTHAARYLGRIEIPVLALAGAEDAVTPAKEIMPRLNLIPRVQTHIIPNARHDILNEIEPIRAEAWQKINAFLAG